MGFRAYLRRKYDEAPETARENSFALVGKRYCDLLDGYLDISSNYAERSIKPFVIGRKNWLCTPTGAKASAILYSLIETAKETDWLRTNI